MGLSDSDAKYFAEEKNNKVLGEFLSRAATVRNNDPIKQKRIDISQSVIGYIYRSPGDWDKRCSFNIEHIGSQFLSALGNFNPSSDTKIDDIYCMAYRFLCEFDFMIGAGLSLDLDLSSTKNFIMNDLEGLDERNRSQIIYASYMMPVNIAKQVLNEPGIQNFFQFDKKKDEAEKLRKEWDKEINDKKAAVEALKEKLNEYKSGFNFVGLYSGFESLRGKKAKEATRLFWALMAMGFVMIVPFLFELAFSINGLYEKKPFSIDHLLVLLPLVSIEVILIYFFRVLLHNYNSVKAQNMQIELRQTLCQFIQSYAEYAVNIKKQDGSALEKFESLIFSGILTDPAKLPSTYDGIEQIGKLVKSWKNPQ